MGFGEVFWVDVCVQLEHILQKKTVLAYIIFLFFSYYIVK